MGLTAGALTSWKGADGERESVLPALGLKTEANARLNESLDEGADESAVFGRRGRGLWFIGVVFERK